jgi:sugar lactone lactonase YvrE
MSQRSRTFSFLGARAALVVFVLGCGNRADCTEPLQVGNLVVTVSSRVGVSPAVVVHGPAGYLDTVTTTTTLHNLAVGTYTITADSASTRDSVVGASIDTALVTGSPALVTTNGTTQVTAAYGFARLRGAMWFANNAISHVTGLAPSQLDTSAIIGAAASVGGIPSSSGVAFDAAGNMWVTGPKSNTLRMYTIAQRSAVGSPAPTIEIVSPGLSSPQSIAFDASGTLWIADADNGLIGFSSAQLAASGSAVIPAVTIVDTLANNPGPYAIAFDAAGNAWVVEDNNSNIVKYTPSELATSGTPTPAVRLSDGSLANPGGIAFDSHGNLWFSNEDDSEIGGYTPAQIAASGSPIASMSIEDGGQSNGIAFDNSGSLWVADYNNQRLLKYTSAQLTAGGTPTPAVTLTNLLQINGPQQIAFDSWVVVTAPLTFPTCSRTTAHRIGTLGC